MSTEKPCLVHYAKDKEKIVRKNAGKTGFGITLWQKQDSGVSKPYAFGSRYLNASEKKISIDELELLALVWGLAKFRFNLYRKKSTLTRTIKQLIKHNRSSHQYRSRLTFWLDH